MRSVGLSGWLYAYEIPPAPRIAPPTSTVVLSAPKSSKGLPSHSNRGLEEENGEEMTTEEQTVIEDEDCQANPTEEDSKCIENNENSGNAEESNNDETNNEATPTEDQGDTEPAVLPVEDCEMKQVAEDTNNTTSSSPSKENSKKVSSDPPQKMYCSPDVHGFVFAVHRKTVSTWKCTYNTCTCVCTHIQIYIWYSTFCVMKSGSKGFYACTLYLYIQVFICTCTCI